MTPDQRSTSENPNVFVVLSTVKLYIFPNVMSVPSWRCDSVIAWTQWIYLLEMTKNTVLPCNFWNMEQFQAKFQVPCEHVQPCQFHVGGKPLTYINSSEDFGVKNNLAEEMGNEGIGTLDTCRETLPERQIHLLKA